jgi:cytochrome c553
MNRNATNGQNDGWSPTWDLRLGMLAVAAMGVAATVALVSAACAPGASLAAAAGSAQVDRGKYLVSIMGCNDCHTPLKMTPSGPVPDLDRFLSGHPESIGVLPPADAKEPWPWVGASTNTAFSGPWGVSYTANLTPDRNTGLGIWTEDMFLKAIKTGRHMGTSRPILPPMPWTVFRNATDDDLRAVFAYLQSLPPTKNRVPDPLIADETATPSAQ